MYYDFKVYSVNNYPSRSFYHLYLRKPTNNNNSHNDTNNNDPIQVIIVLDTYETKFQKI